VPAVVNNIRSLNDDPWRRSTHGKLQRSMIARLSSQIWNLYV